MKKWLDKYKEAENGIEGTMGGLTDQGFNYNGAWGGTMQMGGNLPGSVGFTYARTQGAAPSNGPYAKKTKASAQNGMEMKFYQEGLDWKPKNISQDGSKNPKKKKTLILAEHNPEFWDNPDSGKAENAVNPFITEASGIKNYVNKYFPNEDVEIVPTYKQNIRGALAKSDPNTRLVVMGHSGDKMFGIPTDEFIESVGNTRYENCYAGICYGNDLPGIGSPGIDKDITGKMVSDRFPESYNLQNFNIRSNNAKWVGFAPVDRGGEEGFRDSFFRRSINPEVLNLENQIKKIDKREDISYDEKVKMVRPINDKLQKLISQNKEYTTSSKATDTKKLDYIQYPARTTNYGDPLIFDQQKVIQKNKTSKDGSEIPQAQLGIGILPTTEQYQKFAENVGEVLSAPQKALTKLISGKYQKPSEAMDIQNKAGAFVTDLILDPVNILAGAKMAKGVDDMIYPTRTYRAQVPGKNVLGYESSDLSKKVYEKGDWTTKDLDEAFQYLKGVDMPGGRPGLVTGEDMLLTEYKVPFWKKSVKFDEDVVALKEAQRQSVNPNEYIVPRNRFLYPRKTTSLKAVPEHLKKDKFYSASSIPLSKESYQYRSAPYMYVQDQLDAAVRGKKYKKGGEIKKDDMGYWNPENWGEPVEIDSNQITMEGVYEPLIGVSDTGDVQYMEPGGEYEFDGESVIEYPVMQKGGRAPIYVDNPKDPRLKAYTDSLNLYKAMQMQDKLMGPGNKPIKGGYKWTIQELKEGRTKKTVKGLEDYGPMSDDFQSESEQFKEGFNPLTARKEDKKLLDYYKSLGFKPDQIMYHSSPDIVSDKIRAIGSYFDGTAQSPVYKKPEQPVQYRKPEPSYIEKFGLTSEDVQRAYKTKPVVNKGDVYYNVNKGGKKFKIHTQSGGLNYIEEIKQPKAQKKTEPAPVASKQQSAAPPPIERKQNIYEGTPVYSPGIGSGLPSALIGFANQKGDTTYIKPEDYERFAVPKYAKEYIETKKQKNGGWLDKYN